MGKYLILIVLGVVLPSCASAPNVNFYILEPLSKPNPATTATAKPYSIGIGPISLPVLLEHKQILTRLPGNAVQLAEFQQWASPLQDNLLQALTRNVSNLKPGHIVRAYPWSIHGTVDLQIIVDILRFDTMLGESANLEANWTIKSETSHAVLKNGRTVINHALADSSYPGVVRAMSLLLAELSQELSAALYKLELGQ